MVGNSFFHTLCSYHCHRRYYSRYSFSVLISKLTSPEQSYAAALHQDTQHQETQAPQMCGKSLRTSVQQHLPQQEIQRIGLSVQAPNSTNNDTLKISTVVQQIMKALNETVSEKDKIMVITKWYLT
jgi:hypothetical protein